jgi:hypothetical protein
MKPYSDFFSSIPFHMLYANYTACTVLNDSLVSSGLATPNRSLCITYACTRSTGETVTGLKATIRLPNGKYDVVFIDPATLKHLGVTKYESGGLRETGEIILPDFKDDILIKIVLTTKKEITLIEGTR